MLSLVSSARHGDSSSSIRGTKAFATSATGAQWAILLVDVAGPGGVRHARGPGSGVLLLACDLTDPTVTVDTSWWDPVGMRATASHLVRFDDTFVPRAPPVRPCRGRLPA